MIEMLAFLALQATPVVEAEPEVVEEIVVIGQKLKKWRGNWRVRNGAILCRTVKSTGDKVIDAIGCRAVENCVNPHAAEIIRISDSKQPRAQKRKAINRIINSTVPCTAQTRSDGIAALAQMRTSR